jgi:hypothetical protein
MQQLANCCTNLTSLSFSNPMGADNGVAEPAAVARSLRALTRLDCLLRLHIVDSAMEFQREAYTALADLPSNVKDLYLSLWQNYTLDGLLELTSCCGLQKLVVRYNCNEQFSQVVDVHKVGA